MIDIQKNISALLKERGVLRKQVAYELGITEAALSNWFTRKNDLSFSQITRICEVAKIPIIDAITYPEKYVPADEEKPVCEECLRKDKIINSLTELLEIYKNKNKNKRI